MSAAIEDVARRAGVSVATVSRALRGLPNVAPSTRARVLEAARALEYVADPYAARLAAGRGLTVGLIVPMLGPWYYARLFSGVEAALAAAGYDVLPFTMSGPDGVEGFLERLPFRKRVDGLVVVDAPFGPEQVRRVARGVPAVTVGSHVDGLSSLTIDNVGAARLAVGHLARLGHRRIALIGGMEHDPFHFAAPVERERGYRAALEEASLTFDPRLVVPGDFSLEGGLEAMTRLLHLDDPPTAVFACSDEMAIGAMQVLGDAALDVPGDVSVVGFDDHDVSEYLGLTTIRQDVVGQGEWAAARLLRMLDEDPEEVAVAHEEHPTRLVVRRTTGPVPAQE